MKQSLFILLILFGDFLVLSAQLPPNQPEQDCINAIPICGDLYTEPHTYRGQGLNSQERPPTSCLNGENNSVWYTFQIDSPGNLNFVLSPLATGPSGDDYDFALYNITTNGCAGIVTGASPENRCNFAITTGVKTGMSSSGVGINSGAGGAAFVATLAVSAGQQFALLVDNFNGNSTQGYTLDFTTSTCAFGFTLPQAIFKYRRDSIVKGQHQLDIELSKPIACSTINANGSGFSIDKAGWHISNVASTTSCSSHPYTTSLTITFDSINIGDTTFHLILQPNSITGYCGSNNTTYDTTQISIVLAPLVPGFTYYPRRGDSAAITNTSTGADSISYYIQGYSNTFGGPNPVIVLPDTGSYVICQVITNFVESDTLCKTVTYTGVESLNENNLITLSPNPTTRTLTIEIPISTAPTDIQVFNALGMKMMEHQYPIGGSKLEIDISQLPAATYLMHIRQGSEMYLRRVVKY